VVDKTDKRQENRLSCRCFDDCRLANTSSIEVDIGSFFGRLSFNIEIKEFDNVADKVRQLSESRISNKTCP
jgi:hypothetical protein